MIKLCFFCILAYFYLITSSSMVPKHDDFGVMRSYCRYLNSPTRETYSIFKSFVREYYGQSPIDCLKLTGRYQDWVFKVVFWNALAGPYYFFDPTAIIPCHYFEELKGISQEIRKIFLNCSCSEEAKFKTELETISLLIKLAERASSKLKYLGITDKLVNEYDNLADVWKYLIRNISIDFENKTIDYCSLSRTINEICSINKADSSSSNGAKLCLSKRYALFWLYLQHIYMNNCTVIIDSRHHYRALISYLIMKLWFEFHVFNVNEFYPNLLRLLFEKLYENKSLKLVDPILELLRRYDPKLERTSLGASRKISNYSKLAHFLTEKSKRYNSGEIWRIRVLAELEVYLIQHCRKPDYFLSFSFDYIK